MKLSNRKKILVTIDWFLPGYKAGGPIQSCANLVQHLKPDYDFYILTRDTDYCETVPYQNIQPNTWVKLEDHVQVFYFSAAHLKYKSLFNVIKQVGPDVAFINGIYSLYFSILPLFILKRLNHQKIIVSARGMLAQSAINVKGGKKKLFLKAIKASGLYKGIRFHATNEEEEKAIGNAISPTANVVIAPNLPKLTDEVAHVLRNKQRGQLNLVSIARISPEKNTKYALALLADYKGSEHINFDIYGPVYNADYWQACEEVIRQLPDNIKVKYKGSVQSDKVAATLSHYHALFLPTQGENFGHIILESFTAGCPVIISDQTPWRNLEKDKLGFDLPLAEPNKFRQAIQQLTQMDQQEYNIWSERAYFYGNKFINNAEPVQLNRLMFEV
ncbi:glycosyltransferase [Pontibacter arcticus]|uniref:Glycosyl transferase n=1 Tax=Pontibacter arcticus TaxID=2080288 RepID=A0A364RG81_9BACT|nr:glycosyltransferase [Pontibacter arcticus]RAU83282.1 glycosyl transferase [Pontibacter arcticus]